MKVISRLVACTLVVILATAMACSSKKFDENSAADIISSLPEVKAYIKFIGKSGDQDVTPFLRAERDSGDFGPGYFMITIGESRPTREVAWHRFFVDSKTKKILVADKIGDGYLSLDEWRVKYKDDINAVGGH